MFCSSSQTNQRKNSNTCTIIEYPIGDSSIDFVIARISGRYPETGLAVNDVCRQIIYVQQGVGKVIVEEKEYPLQVGDCILIPCGDKFYWDGELTVSISCHPSFHLSQYRMVES